MEIEVLNIDDLIPYENNAKEHPKEQIEQIKKSIIEFNNNDPIAIDENNVIIEGHGRHEALKQLGYEQVECIRLSHLNEEQKKAYRLIHNKLTMNSDYDFNLLRARYVFKKRKVAKAHQNILIFYKGDINNIPCNYSNIEVGELDTQ